MIGVAWLIQIWNAVGRRVDAAAAVVATDKTIMSYTKGLIQELDQRAVGMAATGTVERITYVDVVNISDKGVLTGVYQRVVRAGDSIDCSGAIKVILDGVTIFEDVGFSRYTFAEIPESNLVINTDRTGSLSFNHRFNTSLQVQHKTNVDAYPSPTPAAFTAVTYTKDQ